MNKIVWGLALPQLLERSALTGATAGAVPHAAGLQINKLKDRLAAGQGLVLPPTLECAAFETLLNLA